MYYLISVNLIAFVLMYIDKKRAVKHKMRIPENTLIFFAFLGGCYGMLLGMYKFHHKTKKLKFKLVHVLVVIYLIFIIKFGGFR